MRATRTATIDRNGKITEITVKLTRAVTDKIAYCDGDNVNLGKETREMVEITVIVNGKVAVYSHYSPEILDKKIYRNYNELVAKGAYARLCDSYIGKEMYDTIMAMISEATAEIDTSETAEYATVKAAEVAQAEKEIEAIKNANPVNRGLGWCDKCHSYCWGDCES